MKFLSILLLLSSIISCDSTRSITPTQDVSKQETQRANTPIIKSDTENTTIKRDNVAATQKAKNVIFLIGDGMGIGQITAGTYMSDNKSSLERFPVVGLHKPYSSDNLVTDSAAAATSFACGVKTFNHAIGVDKDSLPVQSILEECEAKGYTTGLVATSTIVHATPASFIAHNVYRRNYEEIALDLLKTDVDYLVGGGKRFFDSRELDDRNLIKEFEAKGYTVFDQLEDFIDLTPAIDKADKFIYFSANSDPIPVASGRDYFIDASMSGINFLDSKAANTTTDGFFIMCEASQIDWGGHANDSEYIISEFQEFDQLIHKVMDWAKKDGETLVVVTADHETGGYTIQPGSTQDSLVTAFTTTKHSGDFIPVFAYGPGSEMFGGIYENTDIYFKMRSALGFEEVKK